MKYPTNYGLVFVFQQTIAPLRRLSILISIQSRKKIKSTEKSLLIESHRILAPPYSARKKLPNNLTRGSPKQQPISIISIISTNSAIQSNSGFLLLPKVSILWTNRPNSILLEYWTVFRLVKWLFNYRIYMQHFRSIQQ